jgi:hypothetical protein
MPDLTPLPEIDWCARATKLLKVEEALLAGDMVTEARFGEDMARYATANLSQVRAALDEAMRNCREARGVTVKRTRYAMRGRMRPY